MGRRAGREAFNTDTYHFHAKHCSKCWEPDATGEELEQRVVLGKGDVAALMTLFVFTALLIPSPSGGFFFSFLCAGESRKSSISSLQLFLHQAFLSVSLGKILQLPTRLKAGGTELQMLPVAAQG